MQGRLQSTRLVLACLAGLLASALMRAPESGAERAGWLEPHIEFYWPEEGEEPVPAVILFSGCGGVRQQQSEYADAANRAGVAALVVDSHAARGIGRLAGRLLVCTGLRMRGQARAGDVFSALQIARNDPRIDGERIALAGWSHGGWTLLDALSYARDAAAPPGLERLPAVPLEGVRGVLLVYPYCGWIIRADREPIVADIPVTAWLVEKDRIANPNACAQVFERQGQHGAAIDWTLYEGLTHAFDAPDQPFDPRMEYDEDATRQAHARFAAWLNESLAGDASPR
ncbi:dienelactone hydrolase [Marinicauda pacifica]|uniref:Dienelactone hydrolase domain-containing protein n=1 Tax=Marinicauda pacifica TaxID=1133559 RepID=A0A4S2H904_9PROT|nr:dienelactone hydrolase family protein [Marinicauda pacifica]TGY92335.1 hypothetical protein E5162_11860 [Marinicauda pacifica]GGE47989.1 dienelactone hydrolase [Marinicauda pacifica]